MILINASLLLYVCCTLQRHQLNVDTWLYIEIFGSSNPVNIFEQLHISKYIFEHFSSQKQRKTVVIICELFIRLCLQKLLGLDSDIFTHTK